MRLPDIPTNDPALRAWWAETRRILQAETDRLGRANLLPVFASTALPPHQLPARLIMVTTSTANPPLPAVNSGSNWYVLTTGTTL